MQVGIIFFVLGWVTSMFCAYVVWDETFPLDVQNLNETVYMECGNFGIQQWRNGRVVVEFYLEDYE